MTVIDLAAEQPRVLHLPRFGPSAGEDAIGQAAAAGLYLDPWQQYVLRNALGERPDGRWSAFEVGLVVARQQGKGSVLEARELAGLLHFNEKLIMHTAHELKTSMEHFRRLLALFDASDDLRKRVKRVTKGNGKEGLEMANGARLHCIARSKGSGRGFSGDLVVLDEAYALTAAQMEATMPTMLARDNAQVWYTSSPPLDPVSGEVLMKVKRRAEAGTEERLAWFDYGLAGCLDKLHDIDLNDRANWYAALPSLRSGRVREENVVALRSILPTDEGFAREILGIWPPDLTAGFAVIPAAAWRAACDPKSQLDGTPAFAVDVAPDRSRASIGVAGRRGDGLIHIEMIHTQPGTGWVVPRLLQLRDKWRPCAIVIDPGSPAGSLIADAEAAGLELVRTGARDVAQAYGMVVDGLCDAHPDARVVRHIGQPELDAAVAGAARRPVGDGHAWDRRAATVDLTPLVAVTNAMWGYAVHGHVQAPTPWVMFA